MTNSEIPNGQEVDTVALAAKHISRESQLARTLVELADTLVADFDIVELLTLLTGRCVEVLGVAAAGIMLLGPDGDLRVLASSSETMRMLELFEIQTSEGPCLDAYRNGRTAAIGDLAESDGGWPSFSKEALASGFRSVQAIPMRLRGSVLGALNLFHTVPGLMPELDVEIAQAFADVATIAILQQRASLEAQVLNEQLAVALNSRIAIEQAKGILAERMNCDMEQSFAFLRNHARRSNQALSALAEAVVSGKVDLKSFGSKPIEKRV